jgi:poly(3-hydroxybutyrate) depolymerase
MRIAGLQRGRTYGPAKTGVVALSNRTSDGVTHHYVLNVPDSYDPARRYQVRFQLHGGTGGRATNAPVGTGTIGALAGAEQIYVIPYAWSAAPWWSDDQVLNLVDILDATKRGYNVDENHVVVSGVSDGGTGAYWVAMRETTPFASFLPLNGYLMVLASSDIDDGRVFGNNLRNKPIFAVNGGARPVVSDLDRRSLHRASEARRRDARLSPAAGGRPQHRVVAGGEGHVRDVRARASAQPLPDALTWETARRTPATARTG